MNPALFLSIASVTGETKEDSDVETPPESPAKAPETASEITKLELPSPTPASDSSAPQSPLSTTDSLADPSDAAAPSAPEGVEEASASDEIEGAPAESTDAAEWMIVQRDFF